MKVTLSDQVGSVKQVKVGFSWTTFFFGIFVPLFRGDLRWSLIMLVLAIISLGISWIIMPFIYNKKYIQSLLAKGFQPTSDVDRDILISKGVITTQQNPESKN